MSESVAITVWGAAVILFLVAPPMFPFSAILVAVGAIIYRHGQFRQEQEERKGLHERGSR